MVIECFGFGLDRFQRLGDHLAQGIIRGLGTAPFLQLDRTFLVLELVAVGARIRIPAALVQGLVDQGFLEQIAKNIVARAPATPGLENDQGILRSTEFEAGTARSTAAT